MSNESDDFLFEYFHIPSPDAEERIAQAWDIILALILEDYETELQKVDSSESVS
jgi:hypothetical protein